jgi:hypothetical protein
LSNSNSQDPSHYQRKPSGKVKNHTGENRRQANIEQSKAEGRKKLLEEAAGISVQKEDSSAVSKGNRI